VAAWLEAELDRAAAAQVNPGRPASLHRLNRTEYANAVRDLIGIEIDAAAMLPPDQQAHGFDTNADALLMAPALLDRYLNAAAKISRLAVGDPTIPPAFERYTAVKGNANEQTWLWQSERLSEDFPLGSRGGIAARHYFPVDGEYVLRVRLQRTYADVIRGLNEANENRNSRRWCSRRPLSSGRRRRPGGTGCGDYREVRAGELTSADDALQVRVPLKAGLRTVVATIVKASDIQPEGLGPARIPIWSREGDVPTMPAFVSSLLIGGPYNGQVPTDSPSRGRIFVCRPAAKAEETGCATKIVSTLARRAYRRPATADDVQVLLGFYKSARESGDFDTGIRAALERVLVSPIFSSGSKRTLQISRRMRSTVCPTSNWLHDCHSFSGAVFPMTHCSTWPSAEDCAIPPFWINRYAECSQIHGRARPWCRTFSNNGWKRETSGC
jgi:hypothetical protein